MIKGDPRHGAHKRGTGANAGLAARLAAVIFRKDAERQAATRAARTARKLAANRAKRGRS